MREQEIVTVQPTKQGGTADEQTEKLETESHHSDELSEAAESESKPSETHTSKQPSERPSTTADSSVVPESIAMTEEEALQAEVLRLLNALCSTALPHSADLQKTYSAMAVVASRLRQAWSTNGNRHALYWLMHHITILGIIHRYLDVLVSLCCFHAFVFLSL